VRRRNVSRIDRVEADVEIVHARHDQFPGLRRHARRVGGHRQATEAALAQGVDLVHAFQYVTT
jgi:hypothetical protein